MECINGDTVNNNLCGTEEPAIFSGKLVLMDIKSHKDDNGELVDALR